MPVRVAKPDCEKAAFIGDWHIPYHDPIAVELVLKFLEWFRPDTVFILGDYIDAYSVSRFDKDPQRLLSLQSELDEARGILCKLRRVCPRARIIYIAGNHEDRLRRYLWKAPEISVLDNLQLPALLGLEELDIDYHGYERQLEWHGLLVEHGDRVSKHSAYTAKAMLEARGVSGISGHSHRLAAYYRTDNGGVKVWYENGCVCDTNPTYVIGKPNWAQGFTVAHALKGRQRFAASQIPILSGRLFYDGRVWEAS